MNYEQLKSYILRDEINEVLRQIKGTDDLENEKKRYLKLLDEAYDRFGDGDYHFISSPGRTEIGGNHTDHQHGHVVAASLNMDNVCIVKASGDNICTFSDPKHKDALINLENLEVKENEKNTSISLLRGVASRVQELGYKIGGFRALSDSEVLVGSGISSSACYEVMLVEVFNTLFNEGKITSVERAVISQYAENVYFGKPCGLLDQLAISVGGFVAVDFKNPNNPDIESFDFDFADYGYDLVLVNTKGDHSNLSHEYAAVPEEIKEVANFMGVDVLRDGDADYFFSHIKEIREAVKNDRAVLRSLHFYNEDRRAVEQKLAIARKDIDGLLALMNESGKSSYMYLQNVYPASRPSGQSLAVGLAMSEYILGKNGAYRVHGGGFEGTIQAIVPHDSLENYKIVISSVFGDDAIMVLKIRPFGTKTVI